MTSVSRPCEDPNSQDTTRLQELPDQLVEEIAPFFVAYKKREGHEVEVTGCYSQEAAVDVIEQARERFARRTASADSPS